jgi:hypothetical protein
VLALSQEHPPAIASRRGECRPFQFPGHINVGTKTFPVSHRQSVAAGSAGNQNA